SKGNRQIYQVVVDTSKLKADKTYSRRIIFYNNSSVPSYPVEVRVKTAKIPSHPNIKLNESAIKFVTLIACSIISVSVLTSNGVSATITGIATSEATAKYGQAAWNEFWIENQKHDLRKSYTLIRTEEIKSKSIDYFYYPLLSGAFIGNFLPILASTILNLRKKPKRRISGWYLLSYFFILVIGQNYSYAFFGALFFCPLAAQLSFYIIKNLFGEDRKFGDYSYSHYEKNREHEITTFDANLFYFLVGFVFWSGHIVGFLNPFVITGFLVASILIAYKFLLIPIKNRKII
ncbi:MAG: hypothetical protein ACKPCM_17145, partial [Pseudanabaena sp.]